MAQLPVPALHGGVRTVGGSGAAPHTPTSFPRASLADPFQGQARRQTALPLGARLCDAMLFGREPEKRAASDARLRLL